MDGSARSNRRCELRWSADRRFAKRRLCGFEGSLGDRRCLLRSQQRAGGIKSRQRARRRTYSALEELKRMKSISIRPSHPFILRTSAERVLSSAPSRRGVLARPAPQRRRGEKAKGKTHEAQLRRRLSGLPNQSREKRNPSSTMASLRAVQGTRWASETNAIGAMRSKIGLWLEFPRWAG